MGKRDIWVKGLKVLYEKGLTPEQIKSLSRNSLFFYLFSEGFSLLDCFGLYKFISEHSLEEIREIINESN